MSETGGRWMEKGMAAVRNGEIARRLLKILMWVTAGFWMLYWVLTATSKGTVWMGKVDRRVTSTFMGVKGNDFTLQALPVIVLVVVACLVIELQRRCSPNGSRKRYEKPQREQRKLLQRVVFLRSPLGTLTVGDLLFITTILFLVIWVFSKKTHGVLDSLKGQRWEVKLATSGVYMAYSALIPLSLLWLPVSRSSPLLRAFGISFEHAVRYHIWLGGLTIVLLFSHGTSFTIYFVRTHTTDQMFNWSTVGAALVAGVVALICMLIMFATSLPYIRRKFFDLFFTVHQLYFPALLFFTFHVINMAYFVAIPVLLFFLDRFMRFVQSRKSVNVLSAKLLPSGVMELKFAGNPDATYHPLSFVFINFPSVSRFQWHPFSVTSSPLDGTGQLSICIKPLGTFTRQLHNALMDARIHQENCNTACPFVFKAGVEGFYGGESEFYLNYKSLVLVAGGIGVTPYLAIIRDMLHRYRLGQKGLPSTIRLIFCVRQPKELSILSSLDLREIVPNYEEFLNLHVDAFVTSTSPADYASRDELNSAEIVDLDTYEGFVMDNDPPIEMLQAPRGVAKQTSGIVGTGKNLWVAAVIIATIVGFIVVWGLFNVWFIEGQETTYSNWKQALLFQASIAIAILVFGGGTMLLWARFLPKSSAKRTLKRVLSVGTSERASVNGTDPESALGSAASSWPGVVSRGKRPVWRDIFKEIAKQSQDHNVGVLVSGGTQMQTDVGRECTRYNKEGAALHMHSISFEL